MEDSYDKPVKRKRRFSWTPARRAAFEKCRKAREAKLMEGRASSSSGTEKSSKNGPSSAKRSATPSHSQRSILNLEEARTQARRVLEALRKQDREEPMTVAERKTQASVTDAIASSTPGERDEEAIDRLVRTIEDKVATMIKVHMATTPNPAAKKTTARKRKKVRVKVEDEADEKEDDSEDEDESTDDEDDEPPPPPPPPSKPKPKPKKRATNRAPPQPKRSKKPRRDYADEYSDGEDDDDVDYGGRSTNGYGPPARLDRQYIPPPPPPFRFL